MKATVYTFKKPVTVLQIFRHIYSYQKDQKSFEDRKKLAQWKPMSSTSGYVLANQLYLPQSIMEEPHFTNCTLLTMEDNSSKDHHTLTNIYPKKNNRCFQQAQQIKLDIFKLQVDSSIDMYLEYGYFEVGIPERPNIKISTLLPHQPVEIKINGKTDASLTARRDRSFKEQQYVYEHLGTFEQCFLLKEPFAPVIKNKPSNCRTVDLLKPLW